MEQLIPASASVHGSQRRAGAPPRQEEATSAPGGGTASSWMRMLSSTFLGESSNTLTDALFSRKPTGAAGYGAGATGSGGVDGIPTFKIALVGGSGVGKSSIVRRWTRRPYTSTYTPTVGIDVQKLSYQYGKQILHLDVWDVASVEVDNTQSSLHSLICEDLDGIFFVFNVHRVSSIAAVDKWRHSLAKYVSAKEIPFFLLAHKADMIQQRIMSSDDIASYAKSAGYRAWMWTVGRSNFGENEKHPVVIEALDRMVDVMWKERDRRPRPKRSVGIFEQSEHSEQSPSLDIVHVDDELQDESLLRIPMRAITTLPRDENMLPLEDDSGRRSTLSDRSSVAPHRIQKRGSQDFGGNWILGNEKGVYLRVTDDSVLAGEEDSEISSEEEDEQDGSEKGSDEDEDGSSEEGDDGEEDEEKKSSDVEDPETGTAAASMTGASVDAQNIDTAYTTSDQQGDAALRSPTRAASPSRSADAVSAKASSVAHHHNDQDAWRFFAGSINRERAESILSGREAGSFLLRRKDARTLVLSYVGADDIHHALIEYANHKYHVGSSKTSQASFASLSRCLRSVRKYAYRGLVFTRNVDFRVVNKPEMALEDDQESSKHAGGRTQSSAHGKAGGKFAWRRPGSGTRMETPQLQAHHLGGISPHMTSSAARPSGLLLAQQEHVRMPPKERVDLLGSSFYEQLMQRLQDVGTAQQNQEDAGNNRTSTLQPQTNVLTLLKMVEQERRDLEAMNVNDSEAQWRQLVKNMELWNRILVSLEVGVFDCAGAPSSNLHATASSPDPVLV